MALKNIQTTLIWVAQNELEKLGYETTVLSDGFRKIKFNNTIEIFEEWGNQEFEYMEGVKVVSINTLIDMKLKLGREKDLIDVELIKKSLGKLGEKRI